MIEAYIEKDIIRQVKLVEFLFELETLNLKTTAERLQVTPNTIKRDFAKITDFLEDSIQSSELTSSELTMSFHSSLTRYDLIKQIYNESKFLRVCAHYILGEDDYLTIVEEEFISVAKAFKVKKEAETYFKESCIMDEEGAFIDNELRYRFVVLSIWMRCDLLDGQVDQAKMQQAKSFVQLILDQFSNNYQMNKREYSFLVLSVYLIITRGENSALSYSQQELNYIRNSLQYQQISNTMNLFFGEGTYSDNEIVYFAFGYNALSLNTSNYLIVEMNHKYDRNLVIEQTPSLKELISQFEREFEIQLAYDILFEKPFLSLLHSMWQDIQAFLVERHYFLSDEQLALTKRVRKVLNKWRDSLEPEDRDKLIFSDTAIEKLCSQTSSILLNKHTGKFAFIIVAEDELSHTIYRKNLLKWLNMDHNVIDDTLYYSLDELPVYTEKWPHIIICERALKHTSEETEHLQLLPISRSSIKEDMRNILLYAYDWQYS
ncbi:helix-turn-helix domain-containing protein [Enterococcus sp. 669A]|uniref:Helix-turn-helix domain-containing protein n=1 Tax=Candidatus Enterococcus moelleringii TaxID=2815325 RepID=A0ABS3L6L5_9ENTE|nr:helix-turn-helix domain-containing protein [Enterococcus sp. 669A]MBO1304725.1 helix-turn-helix domain-containing protein [Enterococcus sp. 669A]